MLTESSVTSGLFALFGGALVFLIVIVLAVVVVQIIANVKLYQKAGKAGWEAIIPYYNTWVLCEIAGVKWWFFLIANAVTIIGIFRISALSPLGALIALAGSFAINYNIAIKFGKDPVGYGIGLTLLPVIFSCILGFGSAKYEDVSVSAYGPITEDKVSDFKNKQNTNHDNSEPKKSTSKTNSKAKFCKNCGAKLSNGKFCSNCGAENTLK